MHCKVMACANESMWSGGTQYKDPTGMCCQHGSQNQPLGI